MNKSLTIGIVAATLLASCGSDQQQSTTMGTTSDTAQVQSGNEEWITLFDGTTTNGWHTYGSSTAGRAWKAIDGALYFDPEAKKAMGDKEGGDLITNEAYDNFHLSLDWKVAPKANSGIIFYVQDEPGKYDATYMTGPEMQVLDNNGHPDAKIYKHKAGDLYDLIASSKEVVKPVGEWNHVEIIANNGKLDFFLNGENIVSTTMWDDNWRNMIANSKFKDWEGFGAFKSGHIALQDHGDPVWFKDIKIKKL